MKKILLRILGLISSIALLLALFLGYRLLTAELTYTNLVDNETVQIVESVMIDSGVPIDNVDLFKDQVEGTNEFLGDFHSFNEGFVTIKKDGIKYNDVEGFRKFANLRVPYMDINCRIALWNLAGDLISAEQWNGNPEETFTYEFSTLELHPFVEMSEEEKGTFYSLYEPIPSDGFHFGNKNAKIILAAWEDRGVSFESSSKRSIINIFGYRPDKGTLEAQHAGLLIENNDEYWFVEKWNPTLPFQVSMFASRKDVQRYLKYRMHTSFVIDATIMENDRLFKP